MSFDQVSTLPALLDAQARARPDVVCLRWKVRGRWYALTWREAASEVARLSGGFAGLGLARGDVLLVVGDSSVEALLLVLAGQRLGAAVLPYPSASLDTSSRRTFAVVERGEQLERLSSTPGTLPEAVVCIDARGVVPDGHTKVLSYQELASATSGSEATGVVSGALPDDVAFAFPPRSGVAALVSHEDALTGAARLLENTGIDATCSALMPRALSLEVARSFVGAWLRAGFCLSFPERSSTRDVDRPEIAPSLVVGTATSFARLQERVIENLPKAGSLQRRLVDWALAPSTQGLDEGLRATVGRALVRRPLRKVIGLSRVKLAFIDGTGPEDRVSAFFARLGVELRPLSGGLLRPRELEPPPALLSTVPKEVS